MSLPLSLAPAKTPVPAATVEALPTVKGSPLVALACSFRAQTVPRSASVSQPLPSPRVIVRKAVSARQSVPGIGTMLVRVDVELAAPKPATVPLPQNTVGNWQLLVE